MKLYLHFFIRIHVVVLNSAKNVFIAWYFVKHVYHYRKYLSVFHSLFPFGSWLDSFPYFNKYH